MKRQDTGYRTDEFTPKGRGASYNLAAIPEDLWAAFRARCRTFVHPDGRRGISVRARVLGLIKRDVEESTK